MKKIISAIILLITAMNASAQKPLLLNYDEATARAKTELDSSMISGALRKFAMKSKIKGEYVFDITIHEKGKVLTVFSVSHNGDDLSMQTRLKDLVKDIVFHFKMPAGKLYKFQYIFQFD